MVGGLVKSIGIKNISLAEDVVQETFLAAQLQWIKNPPDNPQAWLFKVCKNIALKLIKEDSSHYNIEEAFHIPSHPDYTESAFNMLLACAHPRFSPKQQVIFALRYAAGFKVDQIAKILLSQPETITKTLQRIKVLIKTEKLELFTANLVVSTKTKNILLNILYLMFSEGYKTSSGKSILNTILCEDALVFTQAMIKNPDLSTPDARALYALMLFNLSRFEARFTVDGDLIDLEHQDRTRWNNDMIKVATHYLHESKTKQLSKYHIEGTIAYLHCTAPSFKETDWLKIVSLYEQLHLINGSPFIQLNLAIAKFYAGETEEAVLLMKELGTNTFIYKYHLYHVAMGKMLNSKKERPKAIQHYKRAIDLTGHLPEKKYIENLMEKTSYSS